MKRCPRCGRGYTDSSINFCLDDGELLVIDTGGEPGSLFADEQPTKFTDDSPPTVVMDPTRVTNPTDWQPSSPPAPWQGQSPIFRNQSYSVAGYMQSRDQTLPTVSLVLGLVALVLVCCYGGIWLGVPAAIVGFIGMKNADKDPSRYGGRGMAVVGMVLGAVTFLASMVFLFIGFIGRLAS